MYIVDIAA